MKEKKDPKRKLLIVLVVCAAIAACVLLITQIVKREQANAELRLRKERLEALIAEQETRREELEEEADYVKTEKYIEEKAKSIGYVYPDEIIFREND